MAFRMSRTVWAYRPKFAEQLVGSKDIEEALGRALTFLSQQKDSQVRQWFAKRLFGSGTFALHSRRQRIHGWDIHHHGNPFGVFLVDERSDVGYPECTEDLGSLG
jgi:hypothetical protein